MRLSQQDLEEERTAGHPRNMPRRFSVASSDDETLVFRAEEAERALDPVELAKLEELVQAA